MTPLGHQIARLLQPEHWEEWVKLTTCVHHFERNLTIISAPPLAVLYSTGPMVNITKRLTWSERRQIRRLLREMLRGMTERAEERAIEELLRS